MQLNILSSTLQNQYYSDFLCSNLFKLEFEYCIMLSFILYNTVRQDLNKII